MGKHTKSVVVIFALLFLLGISLLHAQWIENGIAICTETLDQNHPQLISDGAGGAVITWHDYRNPGQQPPDIYIQRINANGDTLWQEDGLPICTAIGGQLNPQIVNDGAGGAIIAWYDGRNGAIDIYAQKIDISGIVQWTSDGEIVCASNGEQWYPQLVSDYEGGAIITWHDSRNYDTTEFDIYAQRIDAVGNTLWVEGGVLICNAARNQMEQKIISDGSGGAIITWDDYRDERNGSGIKRDIYTQRIDSSGSIRWTENGIAICTEIDDQQLPQITSDGTGGAIITWQDNRAYESGIFGIYAQRIDSSGNVRWTTGGVPLCVRSDGRYHPQIISTNAGGAIVTWNDIRDGDFDVYAERIDSTGERQWGDTCGVVICKAINHQVEPQIISDGNDGAIIVWEHRLSDIYAQRIDADGNILWPTDGIPICTAPESQVDPQAILASNGEAIITWADSRSGDADIYAMKIPQVCRISPDTLDFGVVEVGTFKDTTFTITNVGSGIISGTVTESCDHYSLISNGSPIDSLHYSLAVDESVVVTVRFEPTIDGTHSCSIGTGNDCCSDVYCTSFGLPPIAVQLQSFSASWQDDHVEVAWTLTTADKETKFLIFRKEIPGKGIEELSNIEITREGLSFNFNDRGIKPGVAYLYRVEFFNEESRRILFETDLISIPALPLTLYQNHPNPFNPSTTIKYYLPENCQVSLEIFDVSGKRIICLVDKSQEKGFYTVDWNGKDINGYPVSSGIYFYRLAAGKETISKKMVLLR